MTRYQRCHPRRRHHCPPRRRRRHRCPPRRRRPRRSHPENHANKIRGGEGGALQRLDHLLDGGQCRRRQLDGEVVANREVSADFDRGVVRQLDRHDLGEGAELHPHSHLRPERLPLAITDSGQVGPDGRHELDARIGAHVFELPDDTAHGATSGPVWVARGAAWSQHEPDGAQRYSD